MVSDLGIRKLTRQRWRQMIAAHTLLSALHDDMSLERARLRQENALLRQQCDLLKKATAFGVRKTRLRIHAFITKR